MTLIPGDGAGPEVCAAAQRCLEATGAAFEWDVQLAGLDAFERMGTSLPDSTIASLRRTGAALKGPLAPTPITARTPIRSVNLFLRQEFDLYACVRPCKLYAGVRSPLADRAIDLVVIRENTEDLYLGMEFEPYRRETDAVIETLQRQSGKRLPPGSAIAVKAISKDACARIVDFAFDYARRMRRRKVTAIHKANVLRATDGLFL
ncbi:MAG TPA: isocitrate/isopropylmalate family dehydrogenase, partial [Planctomycetia bacterium]|nr:isocitrate/isopropylmalate family dehydrogenase [Planctomycetia bacterium]